MNDTYPQPVAYLYLGVGDTPIRAYFFCNIDVDAGSFHPHSLAQSMRITQPLREPFTWCVYGTHQAVIVNNNDLRLHEIRHRLPPTYRIPLHPYDEQPAYHHHHHDVATEEDIEMMSFNLQLDMEEDFLFNESFQESGDFVSGLTEEQISKNLQLAVYSTSSKQQQEEICVVCQVEFEKNERLGVLQCKHQYHPICITKWLIQQNVCPLCKAQGLRL